MWKCKCGESNPDSSTFCQSCGGNKMTSEVSLQKSTMQQRLIREENERKRLEQERINREQAQQHHHVKMDNLKKIGLDGYYEYKVVSLLDQGGVFRKNSGRVDIAVMSDMLNKLGLEGWHLVTAYSNELGKNALSGGSGGAMFGLNSTVDENILIFERFVRIKQE